MGTLKFYIYLCIFPTIIFSSDSKTVASDEEKNSDYDHTWSEQPGSDGIEEKYTPEKGDDTRGKTAQNLGSLVNVFKKPFIVKDQDREGWEEEKLLFKLFGRSSMEMDTGNSYNAYVRSV